MNKNDIIQKGIKIASKLPDQKFKLVAIITDKKGRVLSIGKNSFTKTSPRQAYYAEKCGNRHKIYLHAELDAIIKLKYTDNPYAIYIVRINKKNEPVLSKPCKICQQALKDIKIKKIYYTGEKEWVKH